MTHKPLWHEAAALAARVHENQYRKDGETPYDAHPARVAMIIAVHFGFTDEAILAAAYLHDVIEDSGTDYDDIEETFGRDVADYVAAMSKDGRLPEAERERAYDEQLAAGPWQGRLIKLADVYDNLTDARTDWGRKRIIERAERALSLAAGDEPLAGACEKLRALVRAIEAGMHSQPV
jgi:(p)ppGpp synthase/HD superfamily hydrolase